MINQQQYQQLMAQGYTQQEIQQAVGELEQEQKYGINSAYNQTITGTQPTFTGTPSPFAVASNDNIVKWQLELDDLLERFEHFLKGDRLKEVDGGNKVWVSGEEEDRVLNDFGVRSVMKILALYVNKNTILANHDDVTIKEKVHDFGQAFKDWLYKKRELFGLDPKDYEIIVREFVDIVHNAYSRSYGAGERKSLREQTNVSQTQQLAQPLLNMPESQKKWYNPLRWAGNK